VIAATARTGPPPKGGWRHRVWPVSPLAGLVEESTAGFVERVNGTRRRRRRPQRLRARVVSWAKQTGAQPPWRLCGDDADLICRASTGGLPAGQDVKRSCQVAPRCQPVGICGEVRAGIRLFVPRTARQGSATGRAAGASSWLRNSRSRAVSAPPSAECGRDGGRRGLRPPDGQPHDPPTRERQECRRGAGRAAPRRYPP